MNTFPKNLDGKVEFEGRGKRATIDYVRKYFDCEYEYHEYVTHNHAKYKHETHQEHLARQDRWYELSCKIDHDDLVRTWERERADRAKKKHAGYELGPRELTLTYSPDWFDDEKAQFFMKQAVERLCNYYSDEIIDFRAVGERTKKGNAHVHIYYELKGGLKITDKNLKRAYFKWDAKHHHHKGVRKTSDFLGYIEKDISRAWFKKIISHKEIINNHDRQDSQSPPLRRLVKEEDAEDQGRQGADPSGD